MKIIKTGRGFKKGEFIDQYGVECSIQESSLATEACIWLGCNKIGLKTFTPGVGWKDYSEDEIKALIGPNVQSVLANTRMHLTIDQVKELLPHLHKFVETGWL